MSRHSSEDFHFGADVYSSDGKHVGTLDRVVIDEQERHVREVIVKESKLFSGHLLAPGSALLIDDLIVPADAVAEASPEKVTLKLDGAAVRRLPPYLSYRYAPLQAQDVITMAGDLLAAQPFVPRLEESAAKRSDELEVDAGENVMLGHTGEKLGEVKDVLVQDGELVGVVLHRGFFGEDVILPRRFLERSDDLALFAHLSAADLEHLKPSN